MSTSRFIRVWRKSVCWSTSALRKVNGVVTLTSSIARGLRVLLPIVGGRLDDVLSLVGAYLAAHYRADHGVDGQEPLPL